MPQTEVSLSSRLAGSADQNLLLDLINRAFAAEAAIFRHLERTDSGEIAQLLQTGTFLVVESDGQPAGTIYAEIRGEGRAYLGMLAVDPEIRNRGVGHHLLDVGEGFCRSQGCTIVEALALASKTALVEAYQRCGYRIVGRIPFDRPELIVRPTTMVQLEKDLTLPVETTA